MHVFQQSGGKLVECFAGGCKVARQLLVHISVENTDECDGTKEERLNDRNKEYWDALRTNGISRADAIAKLESIFNPGHHRYQGP